MNSIDHLTFMPVNGGKLKNGEKYLIFCWAIISSGIYIGYNGNILWSNYTVIKTGYNQSLNWNVSFYKLIPTKEKIQQAMELRAINIILQNIIGDKTFNY
jgi:hypothetical protein